MGIGQLRHRLTLQMVTSSSKNSFGEEVDTTADMGKVWGSVVPLSGRELQAAQQAQSRTTHKIIIRHRENVTPRSRIIYDGRTFEVEAITNREERGRWLDIMAVEST